MKLQKFQKEFERAVENPDYDTVVMSGPRSLGKTFSAARILTRCLTPGDSLFQAGKTYILGAATLDTARMAYAFIRDALADSEEYTWTDSANRLGAVHIKTKTTLRVISSNAKASFGLVNVPLVVLDEPGALENVGGQMLSDSLFTAQGKVGSRLKVVMCGTLAPMALHAGHWWYDLVHDGSNDHTHVTYYHGERETWDTWATIRRSNPLIHLDSHTRKTILRERNAARLDTRLKARFMSYRLNLPTQDEATTLLTVDDYQLMIGRPTPEREGQPIVGIDLGQNRSWSAAVAMWRSGRVEALATCPGIPDVEELERRDRVAAGTYRSLITAGLVTPAEGLRVQPPALLWERIQAAWGTPVNIVGDFFKLDEMADAVSNATGLETRRTRWSESSKDIRALRQLVKDGPLVVDEASRPLVAASLGVAAVMNDDAGNVKLVKRGVNNQSRDDVAAALVLVSGAFHRANRIVAERELTLAVV